MRVLFISSGNKSSGISSIVRNQGESLRKVHIDVSYFAINGKGLYAYLRHIFILRKHLKHNYYDIYHAHYSFSAYTAALAGCRPLIVSLMGSDMFSGKMFRILIKIFAKFFWNKIIVKSQEMARQINPIKSIVIPNGVDTSYFKVIRSKHAFNKTRFVKVKNIIFVANPSRPEKNFTLAREAVNLLDDTTIKLHPIYNLPQHKLVYYYNTADVLLMTSFSEGSPNVIKEAMACNCPVVATDVGDIRWLFGETPGYFITSFDPEDIADKIKTALEFREKHGKTKGRERILDLGLDSDTVAKKIIGVHEKVLEGKKVTRL